MAKEDDIRLIIEQERTLVFPAFSEDIAFSIGCTLRALAQAGGHAIAAQISMADRPLFYMALEGTTGDNQHWLCRKANIVQRLHRSSYRVVLEHNGPDDFFGPRRGLDNADFVLAGGGFPIRVKQVGVIGSICVSGLREREDHRLVVEALADHLGADRKALTLPPL